MNAAATAGISCEDKRFWPDGTFVALPILWGEDCLFLWVEVPSRKNRRLRKFRSVLNREAEKSVATVDVQLSADVRTVMFYGSNTYMHFTGDLGACLCARY